MAFPTPTVPDISGVIAANQFNQNTNASVVAAITRGSGRDTAPVTNESGYFSGQTNIGGYAQSAINSRDASSYSGPVTAPASSSYFSGPTNPGGYAQSASNFKPENYNTSSSYYSGPTSGGGYAASAINTTAATPINFK